MYEEDFGRRISAFRMMIAMNPTAYGAEAFGLSLRQVREVSELEQLYCLTDDFKRLSAVREVSKSSEQNNKCCRDNRRDRNIGHRGYPCLYDWVWLTRPDCPRMKLRLWVSFVFVLITSRARIIQNDGLCARIMLVFFCNLPKLASPCLPLATSSRSVITFNPERLLICE